MLTDASSYDQLYRDFRWEAPARFNIAIAAYDRHADGSGKLALIYRDEDGSHANTAFDELRDFSRRFANVLRPGFAASDASAREIQDFVNVKLAAHEY